MADLAQAQSTDAEHRPLRPAHDPPVLLVDAEVVEDPVVGAPHRNEIQTWDEGDSENWCDEHSLSGVAREDAADIGGRAHGDEDQQQGPYDREHALDDRP